MLIGHDELKNYVGGTTWADVCSRLSQMRVKFLTRPDGKPVTTISAFEEAMRLRKPKTQTQTIAEEQQVEIEVQ